MFFSFGGHAIKTKILPALEEMKLKERCQFFDRF
jgi:hypothetical protein